MKNVCIFQAIGHECTTHTMYTTRRLGSATKYVCARDNDPVLNSIYLLTFYSCNGKCTEYML